MNKKELLFYDAYEEFYAMTKTSAAFQRFCKDAFGEDFSQDGFSKYATVLAEAIEKNGMIYEVTNITEQTYDLLKTKRASAMRHQAEFESEGHKNGKIHLCNKEIIRLQLVFKLNYQTNLICGGLYG